MSICLNCITTKPYLKGLFPIAANDGICAFTVSDWKIRAGKISETQLFDALRRFAMERYQVIYTPEIHNLY